jgi:hypothetical protein
MDPAGRVITKWECVDCGNIVIDIPERQPTTDISGRYMLGLCACRKANAKPRYATFRRVEVDEVVHPIRSTEDAMKVTKYQRQFASPTNNKYVRLIHDLQPVSVRELEDSQNLKHQTISATVSTLAKEGFLLPSGYHLTPEGRNAVAYVVLPALAEWLASQP